MNAEIIAVGSELLLGQIMNSNAQFLSTQLAGMGINVYFHTVVGDNPSRIKRVIEIAQNRSDLLIFTGGLGPTKDDLTKETIANVLDKKLVLNEEAYETIHAYFQQTKRVMTENNKKQAMVIKGASILPNNYGMAPGMAITLNQTTYMLLPGPPKEMQPMFLAYGREFLLKKLDVKERIESRVLRFFGIGESQLETAIEDIIDTQTNPTIAPLAADGEVTLRITAKHQSKTIAKQMLDRTEGLITQRVGEFLYGYDSSSLISELMKVLMEQKVTIASAESLTGGFFNEQLTRISGASSIVKAGVVCYSNEAKETILQVNRKTILEQGAVSESCAKQLAENVRKLANTDAGISFTGVAGPEEVEGKPIGTVYIGLSILDYPTEVFLLSLAGDRQAIREKAVKYGCYHLMKKLVERVQ